jgi:membrane-associated phospholipid phosphatase
MIPFLDWIGYNGPYILLLLSIILLAGRFNAFLLGYIIFSFLNIQLNDILKMHFKQSRPSGQIYNSIDNDKFTGSHIFGMPSGHSQTISFSIMYLYFVTKSIHIFLLMGFIWGLTVLQRHKYKKHSIEQLVVGSIVGGSFAYIAYILTELIIQRYYNTIL